MLRQYKVRASDQVGNERDWNFAERQSRYRSGRNLRRAAEIRLGGHCRLGMLGAPLRAWAAHVMLLGVIAVEQVGGDGTPEVSDGLSDGWFFSVLGHDTFPISRRVPLGSAFWSRRMSAWFRDMMRPNWLKFVATL